jgi:vacuolar-type H+-ATPase subunit H
MTKVSAEPKISVIINIAKELLEKIVIDANKINEETLTNNAKQMKEAVEKLLDFQRTWLNSALDEITLKQIDVMLFETRKVDFKQMKKIMIRRHFDNSSLNLLGEMEATISRYKSFCEQMNLQKQISTIIFVQQALEIVKNGIESESKQLSTELENVNLYYQNFKVSETVKIAYASLFISTIAFLLTILQALHVW